MKPSRGRPASLAPWASVTRPARLEQGVAEGLLEEGLIFALKASLRRGQRRFDEAKDLLERASMLASSTTFRIQVTVSKARLLVEMGDLEEAVALLQRVKDTLFRQAAERERVSEEFAREILSYLRKARYNPELRFEGGTAT
jgi:tetratricopeptide (TPR) repeat protein